MPERAEPPRGVRADEAGTSGDQNLDEFDAP
jgi:hypothetical protein